MSALGNKQTFAVPKGHSVLQVCSRGRSAMVSAVNGCVCFSSCDEAKAKQGKDPHTFPDAAEEKAKSRAHHPAVIFEIAHIKGSEPPNSDSRAEAFVEHFRR